MNSNPSAEGAARMFSLPNKVTIVTGSALVVDGGYMAGK
jgi:hypothetical protein